MGVQRKVINVSTSTAAVSELKLNCSEVDFCRFQDLKLSPIG